MDRELFNLDLVNKAKQRLKEQERINNEKYQQYHKEEEQADMLDLIKNRRINNETLGKARSIIKEHLVYTFINEVYEKTLKYLGINDDKCIRYNMINSYMQEHTISKIMNRFDTASELLSEVAYYINEHTEKIYQEKADNVDNKVIIKIELDDQDKSDFLDSIDASNINQVANKIAMRVQQAQAEFIQYNEEDKAHIEEIINKTKEKCDTTVKESLIENYQRDCKLAINRVKDRDKSIFEVMVNEICKQTYRNDIIKEQFLTENSNLDLDSIVETAEIMYTFLEMCNTIRLEDVNEEYISKVYKEITE